jgi:hypothetical protein
VSGWWRLPEIPKAMAMASGSCGGTREDGGGCPGKWGPGFPESGRHGIREVAGQWRAS